MLLNTAWQANRQRKFVKKCGYPENHVPARDQTLATIRPRPKECRLRKLSRKLSPVVVLFKFRN